LAGGWGLLGHWWRSGICTRRDTEKLTRICNAKTYWCNFPKWNFHLDGFIPSENPNKWRH
jgi:hypothetical protein